MPLFISCRRLDSRRKNLFYLFIESAISKYGGAKNHLGMHDPSTVQVFPKSEEESKHSLSSYMN